jgi:Kdo2-lipid IVA lauroyltransferase/acyltransferase
MYLLNLILYYCIIIPISWLPLKVLYLFSDLMFFVFYHLTGYRKKVVYDNLRKSFPEKSEAEIQRLMKLFYHHFADLIVESLQIFSISEEEAKQRMKFTNPEIFDKHFSEGRTVIMAGGHYNNWELFAVAVDGAVKHSTIALYKPLNNKFFDNKMRESRGKYGLKMVSTRQTVEAFTSMGDHPGAVVFGIDQSPSRNGKGYWLKFLGRDTLVLFGTEKYAKEYNCPVYYGSAKKIKRGYYEINFRLVTENPRECASGEITEKNMALLEADIRRQPEYWLWTHKRWKHTKETA